MSSHSVRAGTRATVFLLLVQSWLIVTQAQLAGNGTRCVPPPAILMETPPLATDGCRQVGIAAPQEIISDSAARRPTGEAAASRLPDKPPTAAKTAGPKFFIVLSAGVYAMAMLDQETTVTSPGWRERELDPLVKPFARVPTPVFIAGGEALATGANWLGWEMRRSRRWRKVWWLPQACSVAGNLYGYEVTRSHW